MKGGWVNSILTSSMCVQECVHDQEAPTCSNGRCGEGDRRENKRNAQQLEQSQEGKGHCGKQSSEKIPTEDIRWMDGCVSFTSVIFSD